MIGALLGIILDVILFPLVAVVLVVDAIG